MFAVFWMAGNDPPVGCSAMCAFAEQSRPPTFLRPFGRPNLLERQRSIVLAELLAPLRHSATAARGLAGRRRRGVQLQPDLWAEYDGGRAGSFGAVRAVCLCGTPRRH